MYFAPHKSCDLGCRYCYLPEESRNSRRPDDSSILESLEEFIEKVEAENCGIGAFCLHGAEPALMNPQAVAAAVHMVNSHWRSVGSHRREVAIQSNGVRLTPEYLGIICRRIGSTDKFLPGYSIDPPRQVHDYYRNKSWKKVVNNYKEAMKLGFRVSVLSVITDKTLEHGEDFIKWMARQLDKKCKFGNPYKIKIKLATGEMAPSGEQLKDFARLLLDNKMTGLLQILSPGYCLSAGNECEWFEFDAEGGCYSCNKTFHPDGRFADWRTEPFSSIIGKRKALFEEEYTHPECAECEYEIICNSGCPADRHKHGKMAGKAHECDMIKIILDEIQKRNIHIADFINNN